MRVNPNMAAGLGQAGERMGEAVQGLGDLGFRVKNATDAAYIAKSQAALQMAHTDFESWQKENPDTGTWADEYKSRIDPVVSQIKDGSRTLSPMARFRLNTDLGTTQMQMGARLRQATTQQNIVNAQGDFTLARNSVLADQTISPNDRKAHLDALTDEAVGHGIFSPQRGAMLKKQDTARIAQDTVSQLIMADPFAARRALQDPESKAFDTLTTHAKVMAEFEANKAANQTRAATMKDWAVQMGQTGRVVDAQGNEMSMEQINAVAAHQEIAPKWVAKLLAPPPKEFDAPSFAAARNEIMTLDLTNDPQSENHARATELVMGQKAGPAREELKSLMDKLTEPKDELNTAVAKGVFAQMHEDRATNGVFIPTGSRTVKEGSLWWKTWHEEAAHVAGGLAKLRGMEDEEVQAIFGPTATKRSIIAAEEVHYAQQMAKMTDWLHAHPTANQAEAEDYRQTLTAPYVMDAVKRSLTTSALPPPSTPPKFEAGKVYTDAAGNKARYTAAGAWEAVP